MMEPIVPGASPVTGSARKTPGSGLSAHILPASATMIGVCMMVLPDARRRKALVAAPA